MMLRALELALLAVLLMGAMVLLSSTLLPAEEPVSVSCQEVCERPL